ncbi:endonuclease III domain-containing protein [Pseudonocardia sp. CA-107938]|uniref:endonuclease III domain-containing protein n=1 Tax=Pseudonocardia sp. CA-107938 TaxID=3240021 RepID=UPI003D8E6BA1
MPSRQPAAPATGVAAPATVLQLLTDAYPDARVELDATNPLELLMAIVLSAQTTDERVNQVTPELFATYRTAADYVAADPADLERILGPVGFYRQKTKAVQAVAAALVERFDGEVPTAVDDLVSIPWVGRKSAHLLIVGMFGGSALAVDTHVKRLAKRLGWSAQADVGKVETEVAALFDESDLGRLTLTAILHGRRVCTARKPACGDCVLAAECPSAGTAA